MRDRTFAQVLHKGFFGTLLMRLLGKNVTIPQAIGLEHDGRTIIKPFAPPYYPTMEAAVRAFVDYKFAPGTGFFRDASRAQRVARSGRDPGDDPAVHGGEHRGGDRLLRVRLRSTTASSRPTSGRSGR